MFVRESAAPEIATAFEVGTRQTILDNMLYFSLALYAQKVKDVQQATTVPDSTTLATQLQNAGDIKSRGVDFIQEFDAKQWQEPAEGAPRIDRVEIVQARATTRSPPEPSSRR